MPDLRSYVFLDSLQLQHAAFLGTVAQGFLPLPYDASLWVEIAPGIEINRITDVAVKATAVRPGMQVIERLYGLLEVHSPSQADVLAAGRAILEALRLQESDRWKPRILSSQVRELAEETGYRAGRLERTGAIFTTPGFTDERIHLFAAFDLTPGAIAHEHHEVISSQVVPLARALAMIDSSEISDGKTIAALFLASRRVEAA